MTTPDTPSDFVGKAMHLCENILDAADGPRLSRYQDAWGIFEAHLKAREAQAAKLAEALKLVTDWRDICDANGATEWPGNPLPTGMLPKLRAALAEWEGK